MTLRDWTDPRDGRQWTVRLVPDEPPTLEFRAEGDVRSVVVDFNDGIEELPAADIQRLFDECLKRAAKHVAHDIGMLRNAYREQSNPLAYTAWFVHCRSVMEFFSDKEKNGKDDIRAYDYVGRDWCPELTEPDGYHAYRCAVNKLAAHLTYSRIKYAEMVGDQAFTPSEEITDYLLGLTELFLKRLPPEQVPWFGGLGNQEKPMTDRQKVEHETLLREIHNIDGTTEKHTQVILLINAALMAFVASQLESLSVVIWISVFGVLICVEWFLKTLRHRAIFFDCHDRLTTLEGILGIKALRPLGSKHPVFSFNGFTILLWFAVFFGVFWMVGAILVWRGIVP